MKKIMVSFAFLIFALMGNHLPAQENKNNANGTEKKENRIEKRSGNKGMRKDEVKNVSAFSMKNFESHFGMNSNVSWVRSDHFDEASFIKDNQATTAYFDFEGNLKGTTTEKSFSDLPTRSQEIITKKYAGFSVESIILYEFFKLSDAQMMLFNSQFGDLKNYFVQMSNGKDRIVLQVSALGQVFLFKHVK